MKFYQIININDKIKKSFLFYIEGIFGYYHYYIDNLIEFQVPVVHIAIKQLAELPKFKKKQKKNNNKKPNSTIPNIPSYL